MYTDIPTLIQNVAQNFLYTVSLISTLQIFRVMQHSIKKKHNKQHKLCSEILTNSKYVTFTNSVPAPRKTRCFSIVIARSLILFRKITPVCSVNHKKHINTVREQNENPSKLYSNY